MNNNVYIAIMCILSMSAFLHAMEIEQAKPLLAIAQSSRNSSRYQEAINYYEQFFHSKECTSDVACDAKTSYGTCLIALGNYKKGYEYFDARLHDGKHNQLAQHKALTEERLHTWKASHNGTLYGCTIFVMCEYGLGDTFTFIKDLKPLKDAGAHIILAAQPELVTILSRSAALIDHVISLDDQVPQYDLWLYLMSARRYASRNGLIGMESPADVLKIGRYIHPLPEIISGWVKKLEQHDKLPLVVWWASSRNPVPGGRIVARNIPLTILLKLGDYIANSHLFVIQGGGHKPGQSIHSLKALPGIVDVLLQHPNKLTQLKERLQAYIKKDPRIEIPQLIEQMLAMK